MALHGRHIGRHRERSETHKPEALEKRGETDRRYSRGKADGWNPPRFGKVAKNGSFKTLVKQIHHLEKDEWRCEGNVFFLFKLVLFFFKR